MIASEREYHEVLRKIMFIEGQIELLENETPRSLNTEKRRLALIGEMFALDAMVLAYTAQSKIAELTMTSVIIIFTAGNREKARFNSSDLCQYRRRAIRRPSTPRCTWEHPDATGCVSFG